MEKCEEEEYEKRNQSDTEFIDGCINDGDECKCHL